MQLARRADGHPVLLVDTSTYMTRLHARLAAKKRVPMWVVYNPNNHEYPGKWVARMWVCLPYPKPSRFVITQDTLGDLRALLPNGTARFEAELAEQSYGIVEAWA